MTHRRDCREIIYPHVLHLVSSTSSSLSIVRAPVFFGEEHDEENNGKGRDKAQTK